MCLSKSLPAELLHKPHPGATSIPNRIASSPTQLSPIFDGISRWEHTRRRQHLPLTLRNHILQFVGLQPCGCRSRGAARAAASVVQAHAQLQVVIVIFSSTFSCPVEVLLALPSLLQPPTSSPHTNTPIDLVSRFTRAPLGSPGSAPTNMPEEQVFAPFLQIT